MNRTSRTIRIGSQRRKAGAGRRKIFMKFVQQTDVASKAMIIYTDK